MQRIRTMDIRPLAFAPSAAQMRQELAPLRAQAGAGAAGAAAEGDRARGAPPAVARPAVDAPTAPALPAPEGSIEPSAPPLPPLTASIEASAPPARPVEPAASLGPLDRALAELAQRFKSLKTWRTPGLTPAEKADRLERAITAVDDLCRDLGDVHGAGRFRGWKQPPADEQLERLSSLSHDVSAVSRAIASAQFSAAAQAFPREQLSTLKQAVEESVNELMSSRADRAAELSAALEGAAPPDASKSAAAIGELLRDRGLEVALVRAAACVDDARRPEFAENLARFAALIEHAVVAPDYARTTGWDQPEMRLAHRGRWFRESVELRSVDRRAAARRDLTSDVREVTGPELASGSTRRSGAGGLDRAFPSDPAAALEAVLVRAFLREIEVPAGAASAWTVTPARVEEALAKERFLPLRALNANIGAIASARDARPHEAAVRALILDLTRHVLEGDFRTWRYGLPASVQQLAQLPPGKRALWMADCQIAHEGRGRHAPALRTREEDGPDLLWTTKIGGPSHGFDYGPRCLLPLLANARTKAIIVDDPERNLGPVARCYLRLLSLPSGAPVLYLEPPQRDFLAEEEKPKDGAWIRVVQLHHAVSKAEALELPLLAQERDAELLGLLLGRERVSTGVTELVVEPSAGIFEASDTLGLGHDFVQTERMTTPALRLCEVTGAPGTSVLRPPPPPTRFDVPPVWSR